MPRLVDCNLMPFFYVNSIKRIKQEFQDRDCFYCGRPRNPQKRGVRSNCCVCCYC